MFKRSFLGMSLLAVLFPPTALAQGTTTGPGALPNNTLALFVSAVGGSSTDYNPVPGVPLPTVSSDTIVLSMDIPSANKRYVLDTVSNVSWAPGSDLWVWVQDSTVYEIVSTAGDLPHCDFKQYDATTGKLRNLPSTALYEGCQGDHLGFVGNSMYYRTTPLWDNFCNCYDSGGELKVMTNGKITTLLSRTDPDNQATMDVADNGTLYAVDYDASTGNGQVWTRNLTTGHRDKLLRSYFFDASQYNVQKFRINGGTLYAWVGRKADKALQIWTTDITVPSILAFPLQLIQTLPGSFGFTVGLNVDHGKVALTFGTSSIKNGIAVLDVATKSTEYYDMGSASINGVVPLWIPGPQTGPAVALATAGQVEPFAPESIVSAYGANLASGTTSAAALPLPTSLGGNTVTITDSAAAARQAPLFYVSPSQINFEVPAGTATGTATVMFQNQNGTTQSAAITIGGVSPGIFQLNGSGLVAAWLLPVISGAQQPLLPVYQVVAGNVVALPISLGPSTEQAYLEMYGTGIHPKRQERHRDGGRRERAGAVLWTRAGIRRRGPG